MRPAHLMFYLYSGMASPGRFKSEFYAILQQPPSRAGILMALETLPSIATLPFFGHLSDRFHSPTLVTHVCTLVSTILFLSMLPVGMLIPSPIIVFALLCAIVSLFSIFYQPLFALAYSMSVQFLRVEDLDGDSTAHALQFGNERLWGCVGYAIITIILAIFLDLPTSNVFPYFGIFLFCMAVFATSVTFFQHEINVLSTRAASAYSSIPASKPISSSSSSPSPNLWFTFREIVFKGGIVNALFLLLFLWICIGMALVDNYLFFYLTSELGASHTLCGITMLGSLASELPIYLCMPVLLRNVGPGISLALSALAYFIRVAGYSFIPKRAVWAILFLEVLQGPMFAIVDAASVAYFAQRAKSGDQAVAQTVLATIRSIGFTAAAATGGVVIEYFGHRALFLGSASLTLFTAVVFVIADLRNKRKKSIPDPVAKIANTGLKRKTAFV